MHVMAGLTFLLASCSGGHEMCLQPVSNSITFSDQLLRDIRFKKCSSAACVSHSQDLRRKGCKI